MSTNSYISTVKCKTAVTPERQQWSYCNLALTYGYRSVRNMNYITKTRTLMCEQGMSSINTEVILYTCINFYSLYNYYFKDVLQTVKGLIYMFSFYCYFTKIMHSFIPLHHFMEGYFNSAYVRYSHYIYHPRYDSLGKYYFIYTRVVAYP